MLRRVALLSPSMQYLRRFSSRPSDIRIAGISSMEEPTPANKDTQILAQIEKHAIWLSSFTIHHANYIRENQDGIKVGGHQASSSSLATIMTVLYAKILSQHDQLAVKPHASPIMHALYYMGGQQPLEQLQRFRAFGGAQSYPSRTKDTSGLVDISTGSVGLGPAFSTFSSLARDYIGFRRKGPDGEKGKLIALLGDAELDEGNLYECLVECCKLQLQNNWWVIDYNRQSLDKPTRDLQFRQIDKMFRASDWKVVTIKYGKKLQALFEDTPCGRYFRQWINSCDNQLYSSLAYHGGKAFRRQILEDIGDEPGVREYVSLLSDEEMYTLFTDLGGHCIETLLEAFTSLRDSSENIVFICYTIKGYGLPLAGHSDNHGLFLNPKQIKELALHSTFNVADGEEWARYPSNGDVQGIQRMLESSSYLQTRHLNAHRNDEMVAIPQHLSYKAGSSASTQETFGFLMLGIASDTSSEYSSRVVTTAPDVATSTNLSGFINKRGIFSMQDQHHLPKLPAHLRVPTTNQWKYSNHGQHVPLGIAENNFFLLLGALGLSHKHYQYRLLPVGTIYDPFISRGLDALNYICYQDCRFILVGTPSGISLCTEGGAHQSTYTPSIGMGQNKLTYYEPTFADELECILRHSLEYIQQPQGQSVYLRLSTRSLTQPQRSLGQDKQLAADIIKGGYWRVPPVDKSKLRLVLVYTGAIEPEVQQAYQELVSCRGGSGSEEVGLLQITSSDVMYNEWLSNPLDCHVKRLFSGLSSSCVFLSVQDGYPLSLGGWLGGVNGNRVESLGVYAFGQSSGLQDLYRFYGIDKQSIIQRAIRLLE